MESDASRELKAIAAISARDRVLIAARRGRGLRMADTPDKVGALLDAARALEDLHAPYALVGGVAVGILSGVPRATADTDIAVRSTADLQAIASGLVQAGFRITGEFQHSMNFRHRSGEPVQIVFDVPFDPMIDRAERFTVSGTAIAIVRKDDLISMKRRAAADPARRKSKSLRDQADVELLQGDVPDPDEGW
jgi:hypothetical protein